MGHLKGHACLSSPASGPSPHGQQPPLEPLPLTAHALAGAAQGAREGSPLLTFSSRHLLLRARVLELFQAEAVETSLAPGQQGHVGLQPAEQFVCGDGGLSAADCPRAR